MTEQLQDIGRRLAALRQIEGYSIAAFAEKMGVSADDLTAYEAGQRDFSFSFLYTAAGLLGVDVMDILSGDSPKLSGCCLVRRGQGFAIDRRKNYSYKHLAYTFKGKLSEPFMVTVEPTSEDKPPEQHAHTGQEFDYMVEGQMRFYLGDLSYDLNEGDSVYYDSGLPHAMQALGKTPATFLAVVMKGDDDDAAV